MSSFWLEYTKDGQRREFSFDAHQVSIGRDKAADFVLDHPTVSRQHALIRAGQNGHELVVLSRGGLTALDGGQVQGEVPLYDGSEIHFGELSFTFRSHSAPARPASNYGSGGGFHAPSASVSGAPGGVDPGHGQGPTTGGTNGSANSSTDWDAPAGGWGETDWDQAPAEEPAQRDSNAVMTWDEIANSAEAQDDYDDGGLTDFEKIQAAQAKADRQTSGNNPLIIYGGIIGIIAIGVWYMWPKAATQIDDDVDVDGEDKPFITWDKSDIDCVGQANCRQSALSAYKVGKNLQEQSGADIANPYNAYKQFAKAQQFLEKGAISPVPAEMANVTDLQAAVKADLDQKFKQARLNFRNHNTRKMYRKMADELDKIQAYFPDSRCLYNQWAVAKERKMKEDGVYPVRTVIY